MKHIVFKKDCCLKMINNLTSSEYGVPKLIFYYLNMDK